jgi:hypothetical protein
MRRQGLVVIGLAAAMALGACQKKEGEVPQAPAPMGTQSGPGQTSGMPPHGPMGGGMPGMPPGEGGMPPTPRQVVVPEDVKKTWQSVTLQVTDKQANKSEDVKVDIGNTVKVGDIEVTVESFLPSFTMTGGDITSKSNQTENPAARIVVKESGNQVFAGWLFSMHPDAHPMEHDKYKIVLKNFTKKS